MKRDPEDSIRSEGTADSLRLTAEAEGPLAITQRIALSPTDIRALVARWSRKARHRLDAEDRGPTPASLDAIDQTWTAVQALATVSVLTGGGAGYFEISTQMAADLVWHWAAEDLEKHFEDWGPSGEDAAIQAARAQMVQRVRRFVPILGRRSVVLIVTRAVRQAVVDWPNASDVRRFKKWWCSAMNELSGNILVGHAA